MTRAGRALYCSCGTRLANDNRTGRCASCRQRDRERLVRPATVPADFWNHPELKAALAARHFGRVLRAYRSHPFHGARPLAQDIVARWLGVNQSQLSRIENGGPLRDLERLVAWSRLLQVPEHILWFRLPPDAIGSPAYTRPRSAPVTAGAPASMSSMPRLPPELMPARTDDLAAMQSLRTADSQLGGGYLYATVASYLQHNVGPRLFGSGTVGSEEHGVFTAAAALTEMAGWMAHDAGRNQLAEQHFQRALGLAHAGQDHQLGASIFGSLSHLAHHTGHAEHAVAYATRGHERLQTGAPYPAVAAKLLAMQARGYAALHQDEACGQRLRQAERILADAPDEMPSPWVSHFDEASLAAEAARCFKRLGQLGAARRQAEHVVEMRPRHRARSRAFAQLMLVSVLIAEGKPDEACAVATEVLEATRSLGSYLVVQQLEQLERLLEPHRRNRDVSAFLDCLNAELRERRWLAHWLPAMDGDTPSTVTA
jgi:tetratricopeptide (TPR) repeat protein